MKVLNYTLLIALFLLIGNSISSSVSFLCLLLLVGTNFILVKKGKIKVPLYFYLTLAVYLIFLTIGLFYGHRNPQIDIKFQLFGFLFYLFLLNKKEFNVLPILLIINYIVLGVYILLYIGKFPNLWHTTIIGFQGRVYGPSIIPIILISFYYLIKNKSFDLKLVTAYIVAIPSLLMTTNLMNIVITGILLMLLVVDFKKLMQPKFIFIIVGIGLSSFLFFNSNYAPDLIKQKIPYLLDPFEYPSLKIRANDLKTALSQENFSITEKIVGKGFGASTTIFRENEEVQAFSDFITFQEIDNGFYYLYHRGGFSLLILFILFHSYLLMVIKSFKVKVGFIFIITFTCLLSIHYFNNMFYLILPFLILEGNKKKKEIEQQT
ncbi:MAG: hypothetical protein P8M33_04360 [Flavobacteriaceae bacterium]|nr:hypothetical protein [Flavobacteriaceae bacterium]